jgi:hypothetical protein
MSLADVTILDAVHHPKIWAPWFERGEKANWASWFGFLRIVFGLPLVPGDLDLYRECTGREEAPESGFTEVWLVCGRRAGKSFILALIACFLALFRDWSPYLAPGELGTVMVLARDRRQARVIFRYCRALITRVPVLKQMVVRETAEEIELNTGIVLEIHTASFGSIRGYTVVALLLDELAFWPQEDATDPDQAVIDAARPAMATVPGAMLLAGSSPYSRRGALWEAYKRYFGKPGPQLIWQAPTRRMNPTILQDVIDRAMEEDPANAAAEYLAQFRTDIESFLSREAVDAVTILGRRELAPVAGTGFKGFADPSGGSGDAFGLAIGHRTDDNRGVLDAAYEIPSPFNPTDAVAELAAHCKRYGVREIVGDRYAGTWPAAAFAEHNIVYTASEKSKSDLYKEFLPLVNSQRVELLDNTRLSTQLLSLERRTARGGRDSIDHPQVPGARDDVANCVAGCMVLVAGEPDGLEVWRRLGRDEVRGYARSVLG